MKTIVNVQTVVAGDNITITGKLKDVEFSPWASQRITVGHLVQTNLSKPRQIQISSQAVFIKRKDADGFAFPLDELVSVSLQVDGQLTDPPVFDIHPTADALATCVKSELPVKTQWQSSTDGKKWVNCGSPKDGKGELHKHHRCIASHKYGSTTSNVVPPKEDVK